MVDQRAAREIALERANDLAKGSEITPVLLDDRTVSFEGGWIFYWDSKASLETNDLADAIGGNSPLVVYYDGTVRSAPTSCTTPQEILSWLAQSKAERTQR